MQMHLEKSVYEHCKHNIETALERVFPPHDFGESANAMLLSFAWLYGGLPAIFVWDNTAIIGIDRDECGYYIGRLQSTITALTFLSQNTREPECRRACFSCVNTLQNTLDCLIALEPTPKP